MSLRNKLLALLSALSITGASVVGLNEACFFGAVELEVQTEKICFETQEDYQTFKDSRIAQFEQQGNLFLWTQGGIELFAVIDREIKEKGSPEIENVENTDDVIHDLIEFIQ